MANTDPFSSKRLIISPMPSFVDMTVKQSNAINSHAVIGNAVEDDLLLQILAEVQTLLTPATTAYLPPDWGKVNNIISVKHWCQQRANEGGFYGIWHKADNQLIGLVFLSPVSAETAEMHIGYLLRESRWGQGYGGELIAALITWARHQVNINTLIAGVEAQNLASVAILEKNGFNMMPSGIDSKNKVTKPEVGTIFMQRQLNKL
ncbi:GNAT family N-acetyltransferase [Shewanella sp. SR44-3]|uniref:GNAT family N-acetyltransferase n=3 Tax=Shewanella TaxID=22 RepID=UPI0015FB6628|nr:GNAT family N-acetyltransferase [Shewanella sp. SR44-3]MBB1269897.1 GNAT family N-acetyltransferase [Shewanella sp. SR44-3]